MFYKFPIIKTIDDVLPHISNDDDFRIVDKDDYTTINYNLASSSTFPMMTGENMISSVFRRECRGLIFDRKGKLIRRAYHKFFNLQEREETLLSNINFSTPHLILNKLDGSMITPLQIGKDIRLATKAGITEVAMNAEVFIASRSNYYDFMRVCLDNDIMPIFEWCSPQNTIVIKHKEPHLVLTAMRNQTTGEYLDYAQLRVHAIHYDIPLVDCVINSTDNINSFVNKLSTESDIEGVVIRFSNGHMIKIKTLWYVAIHKAKDNLMHEKSVIDLILHDKVDDVLPFLDEVDKKKLENYRDEFNKGLNNTITLIRDHYYPRAKEMSRKDFALTVGKELPGAYSSIIFSAWNLDKNSVQCKVYEMVENSLSSQSKIDKTRHLWGNVIWDPM